jgi:hypothetical protein
MSQMGILACLSGQKSRTSLVWRSHFQRRFHIRVSIVGSHVGGIQAQFGIHVKHVRQATSRILGELSKKAATSIRRLSEKRPRLQLNTPLVIPKRPRTSEKGNTETDENMEISQVNIEERLRLLPVACSAGIKAILARSEWLDSLARKIGDGLECRPSKLACIVPSAVHTYCDRGWLDARLERWIVPWGCGAHHIAPPCHITRCKRLLCRTDSATPSPASSIGTRHCHSLRILTLYFLFYLSWSIVSSNLPTYVMIDVSDVQSASENNVCMAPGCSG